jgi:hypothetical protein
MHGTRILMFEHGRIKSYWHAGIERAMHRYIRFTRCPWCWALLSEQIMAAKLRCPNCQSLMRK